MARAIVRLDGVFEAVLGLVLIVEGTVGLLDSSDFPSPVGTPIIVVFGLLLVGLGVVLWWLASSARVTRLLVALAAANAVTAVLAVVWLVAGNGFSAMGTALIVATAAALAALAAVQLFVAWAAPGATAGGERRSGRAPSTGVPR
jgi:hypothetical protein